MAEDTQRFDTFFSFGSNEGDRERNIRSAVQLLETAIGQKLTLSSIIETEADGFDGNDFLNCVGRCTFPDAGQSPLLHCTRLLHICKDIERKLGREVRPPRFNPDGSRLYSNRPIDIDILLYGDVRIDSGELTVPHPRMHKRPFVMVPLEEIIHI